MIRFDGCRQRASPANDPIGVTRSLDCSDAPERVEQVRCAEDPFSKRITSIPLFAGEALPNALEKRGELRSRHRDVQLFDDRGEHRRISA